MLERPRYILNYKRPGFERARGVSRTMPDIPMELKLKTLVESFVPIRDAYACYCTIGGYNYPLRSESINIGISWLRHADTAHCDHSVPRGSGISNDPRNFTAMCEKLNMHKSWNATLFSRAVAFQFGETIEYRDFVSSFAAFVEMYDRNFVDEHWDELMLGDVWPWKWRSEKPVSIKVNGTVHRIERRPFLPAFDLKTHRFIDGDSRAGRIGDFNSWRLTFKIDHAIRAKHALWWRRACSDNDIVRQVDETCAKWCGATHQEMVKFIGKV